MSQGQAGQGGVFFSSFRQIKSVRHTQTSCFFFLNTLTFVRVFVQIKASLLKSPLLQTYKGTMLLLQIISYSTLSQLKKKKNLNSIYRAFLPLFVSVA